ncbi:hypothetical protein HMI55_001543 [Coelomomyces lativittatus]|nr:hypothetical protein HMI55_001543 [Coelomomyces lativittatus]
MFSKLFKNLYDGDDSTSPLDGKYQNKHENLSSVDAVDELFLLALAKNTPLPESSNKMDYEDDFDGEKKNSKLNFIKKNMPRPPRRAANSSKYAKTASLAGENAEGFKKEEILNKKKSEMNSNGNEASSSYISSSAKKKLSENLAIKQSSEKSTSDVKDKFFTHATRTSESKKSPLSNSLSSFIRTNPNPKSTRPLSPQENTRRNIDETTKAPQRRLSLQDSSRFLANISSKEFPDEPSSRRPSSALLVNGRNSSQTSTSSDEKIPTYHVESHENSLNSKKVINGSERKNSMLNILSNKVKALGNSGDNNKETPIQPSLLQKRNVATTLPPLQLENQTSNSLGSKSAGPGINVKLPSKNGKSSAMTISSAGGSRSEESQNISLSNSVSPSLKHRKSSLPPQNSSGANTIIDGDISNDGLIASMKSFLWGSQPNDEKSQSSASPSESLNSKSVEKIAPKHRDVNPPLKSSLPPIPPLKGKMVNENKSGFSKKGVLFIDPNISSSTSGDGRLKSPDIKFSSNSNHWAQKESNEVPLTPARRKSIAESFFGKKRNSFQMNSERLNSSRNPNNKVDAESDLNSESEEESLTYSISFDLNDNENLSPIHPVSSSDLRRNSTRIDQNELNHITSLPGGWGSSTILQDVKYSESQASRNMNLNSDASKQKEIKRIKSPQTNPSFKKQQQINEKVVRENYVREIVSDLESATTSNTSPRSAEVKGETSLPKATSFFGGLFSRKSNENQPNVNVSNTTTSILTDGPFSSISPHASASSKSLEQTSYSQHKSNPRMQQSPSLPSLPGGFSSPEMESLDFEFIRGPNSLLNKPSSSIANTSTFQKNNDNSDFALKAKGQVKEAKATPDFKINTGDFRNPSSLQFNDPSENESWGSDSENASDESSIPPSPLHDPTAPSVFGRLFFSNFSPPKELERSLNTFSPSSKYNTSNPNNKVNFSKAALEATPSSRNQSNMSKSTSNLLEQQKNEFNRTNQRDSSYSSGAVSLKETNNKKSNLGKSTLSFSAEQHLPIQSEDSGFFGRVTSWLSKTAESPSLEDDLGLIQVDDHSEINSSKSFSTYSLDSTNSQYNTPLSTSRENVEDASFFEGSNRPPFS